MKVASILVLALVALSAFGPVAFAKRSLVQEVSRYCYLNEVHKGHLQRRIDMQDASMA
jgi:hypothetical protein